MFDWIIGNLFMLAIRLGFVWGDIAQGEIHFKWPWQHPEKD